MADENIPNQYRVRNYVLKELAEHGGMDWPNDDAPKGVQVGHAANVVPTLVALVQNLGKEIDHLYAEVAELRRGQPHTNGHGERVFEVLGAHHRQAERQAWRPELP